LTSPCVPFTKEQEGKNQKAEFTYLMEDTNEEYDQIYTDRSLKDDKVGFTIVPNIQSTKLSKKG
jgi:hypothetical protein